MKIKRFFVGFTALALMMLEPVSAFAYETDVVPDIEDTALSLTVNYCYSKNDVDIPIPGAEISINRISDLTVVNGEARYTVVDYEDYKDLIKYDEYGRDATFAGISGTESNKLAARFALKAPAPEQTGVTAANGLVKFEGLTAGMYLVRETDATDKAAEYSYFEAFIVSVPLAMDFAGINEWKYDVLADPKTTVDPVSESTSEPTSEPTETTSEPTSEPTETTSEPTSEPTETTSEPTSEPTETTSEPTSEPTETTSEPTSEPTETTSEPTSEPTETTSEPTSTPTSSKPTSKPQESSKPGIPVITGDTSTLFIVILIFFASALLITVSVNNKRRTDKKKK